MRPRLIRGPVFRNEKKEDTMKDILVFLDARMETPVSYGWFHLMFAVIMAALCVLLCAKGRDWSEKGVRRFALAVWIVMLAGEIYKQINFNFSPEADGSISFAYQWYAFPFQMCSSPLYILPLIAFLPEGNVRRGCISYMAFFSLFAGLSVYVYPEQVFVSTIGINIQTMTHHGLQIVAGIFLCAHERRNLSFRFFLKGFSVFLVMVCAAVALNEVMYLLIPQDATFNMFFISRHYPCTLPVLSMFAESIPGWSLPALYAAGYFAAAWIMFAAAYVFTRKARGEMNTVFFSPVKPALR
ncbi:MAG: hypothetical protein CW338_07575 [Clostridiales bacterium]|nr:hypothetical protein [Clostridiales bacterium]